MQQKIALVHLFDEQQITMTGKLKSYKILNPQPRAKNNNQFILGIPLEQ